MDHGARVDTEMGQSLATVTFWRGNRAGLQLPLHRGTFKLKDPCAGVFYRMPFHLALWRRLVALHELVLDHPGNGEIHEPRCREDNEVGGGHPFRHGYDDDPDNYSNCEQRRSQVQRSAIDSGHVYSPSTIFFVYVLCIGAKYRRNEPPDKPILLVCKRVCKFVSQIKAFQIGAGLGLLARSFCSSVRQFGAGCPFACLRSSFATKTNNMIERFFSSRIQRVQFAGQRDPRRTFKLSFR
jgi:hypothetical protein